MALDKWDLNWDNCASKRRVASRANFDAGVTCYRPAAISAESKATLFRTLSPLMSAHFRWDLHKVVYRFEKVVFANDIFFFFFVCTHTRWRELAHDGTGSEKKLVLDLSREGYVTRVCVCLSCSGDLGNDLMIRSDDSYSRWRVTAWQVQGG